MRNIHCAAAASTGLTAGEIEHTLNKALMPYAQAKHILVVPPDISRFNSYAGDIVSMLRRLFMRAQIDVLPALGTHTPMTPAEIKSMYGDLPLADVIVHDWRRDPVALGQIAADFVHQISDGLLNYPIDVEISKHLLDPKYDLILSVGQVVPHEVAGFANYTKNLLVGCGGLGMINHSHYLGAVYGMERIMGRIENPVRSLYNYAAQTYLSCLPLVYILTVTTMGLSGVNVEGVFIGHDDDSFYQAAALSQAKNLTFLETPIEKAVVYLHPDKFKTTWVGNKAIYRTRMALADEAELLVIAPGVHGCGEDAENDRLIRRFGYRSREEVMSAVASSKVLSENLAVAAHLIHGSSEGRFNITYATDRLTSKEVRSLNYAHMSLDAALAQYHPQNLTDGWNTVNGEQVFYISNPSLGLWTTRDRFVGAGKRG